MARILSLVITHQITRGPIGANSHGASLGSAPFVPHGSDAPHSWLGPPVDIRNITRRRTLLRGTPLTDPSPSTLVQLRICIRPRRCEFDGGR